MFTTFEEYENQYYSFFFPLIIVEGFHSLQTKMHKCAKFVDDALQLPQLILKTTDISMTIFALFSVFDPLPLLVKNLCREVKNFTDFLKGFKSIDGVLNFKFSWKFIILNLAGMTLFILSTITLVERFELFNVSLVKASLAAIPVIGILPFGGLLAISLIGLSSMLVLLTFDKQKQLKLMDHEIRANKLSFWSKPLDLTNVRLRCEEYQANIFNLKSEWMINQTLLQQGQEKLEKEKNQQRNSVEVCQKALKELQLTNEKQANSLIAYEKKYAQWKQVEVRGEMNHEEELERFRQAKAVKWMAKLYKLSLDKKVNEISQMNHLSLIAKNALLIASVISGYALLPVILKVGLDLIGAVCGIRGFFFKRKVAQIKTSPIDLEQFL